MWEVKLIGIQIKPKKYIALTKNKNLTVEKQMVFACISRTSFRCGNWNISTRYHQEHMHCIKSAAKCGLLLFHPWLRNKQISIPVTPCTIGHFNITGVLS